MYFCKKYSIYQGAPNISRYINNNSFLQYDKTLQHKLRVINASKSIYDKIVNTNKIEYNYANMYLEHYLDPYLNKEKQVTGFKEQKTQKNLYETGYLKINLFKNQLHLSYQIHLPRKSFVASAYSPTRFSKKFVLPSTLISSIKSNGFEESYTFS